MNALLNLLPRGSLQKRPAARAGLLVLVGPHAASQVMLVFAARLAQRGPLRVLDGGNRFNAYPVAQALRSLQAKEGNASESAVNQALEHIQVARAFTCYQMTALLEDAKTDPLPTLVIDLLDTFYDEILGMQHAALLEERRRLAKRCATHLRRLSQRAPVVVSLRPPPPPEPDPGGLIELIKEAADLVWFQELPAPPPVLQLF